ncbi:MAG: glycosyltransferase family 25 protein [Pseudomonadales bacterium]|nr:glycosyltransferase family 25 protein [Pseudomonadales bacterium]
MNESLLIQVISLKDDVDRRANLSLHFPKYHESFNYIDAVDYRSKSVSDLACKVVDSGLTAVEYGCTLSHIKALKEFVDSKYKFCLILEDDIRGEDSSLEAVKNLLDVEGEDYFFSVLGGQEGLKNSKYLYGFEREKRIYRLLKVSRFFLARTCCYLVDKRAANTILERHMEKVCRADDWAYLLAGFKNIFFANFFSHPLDLNGSHIEVSRKKARKGIVHKIIKDGIGYTFAMLVMKFTVLIFSLFSKAKKCV